MKRISATSFISFIIGLTGLCVMCAWKLKINYSIAFLPNQFSMVFNTALCFFVAGTTLFVTEMGWLSRRIIFYFSGTFLLTISLLTLCENIFNSTIALDQLFADATYVGTENFPGRMAANTAFIFFMTSLFFLLFNKGNNKFNRLIIQTSIFLIIAISLATTFGYVLELEFLYSWYIYTRMAIHTSINGFLLGFTLWLVWIQTRPAKKTSNKSEKKILQMTVLILIGIATVSSVLGFAVSAKQDEVYIHQFLDEYLKDKTTVLENLFNRSIAEIKSISENSEFKKTIDDIEKNDNPAELEKILLNSTYTSMRITDIKTGKSTFKGSFISKPEAAIPLDLPNEARILWDGNFYLELSNLVTTGKQTKKITLQWALNNVNEIIPLKPELKKEVFLCFINPKDNISCLPPSALSKAAIGELTTQSVNDLSTAIKTNTNIVIKNFGSTINKINLAYKPIGKLKIGLVVKTNLLTIYKPILIRLILIVLISIGLVLTGYFFIKLRISPLIKKIHDSEEEFRMAFESSAAGMGIVSLNGDWLRVNSALCQILGYPSGELINASFDKITYPDDYKTLISKTRRLLAKKIESFHLEVRFFHKNHSFIWALLNVSLVRDENGKPEHYILQIQDITKQKEFERKLNYQARHDGLTGLVNRVELEEKINHLILLGKREEKKFAILYIDLDKFKEINDTQGHDAGDKLLQIVAERLLSCTRKSDIVCRLGGDEFVLVLPDIADYKIAAIYAERIISAILKPVRIKNHELYVTTSVGICFFPTEGSTYEDLLKSADHALYEAKEKGRNNYQFCEPDISEKIKEKIAFESDLKSAIDRDEFKLLYMPQINIKNNTIAGVEGLLRWESSQYGFVMPSQIFPIAEETGLIIPLSEWIIKTASNEMRNIQRKQHNSFRLSINISPRHFLHDRMIETITNSITHSKLNPRDLTLEINESLIMQNPARSADIIKALKDQKIKILIDNFGTGYSSLTFLQDFHVDFIKIDRSIIQKITDDSHRAELVTAMIGLAKSININVIAEGVETKEQLDFLIKHGCDEAQGFYFSEPVSSEDISQLIRKYS